MSSLPLACYKIDHFFSPIHHGLVIPTHLFGIWHFSLLQNKQTLLFQSVVCLLISLTAPPCTRTHTCCSAHCSKLVTELQLRSLKRGVEQKDHFTSPAGSTTALPFSWQRNTFSLPTTIMPSSFSNDVLLVVPFLVIAIDCWSLSAALCIHSSCHSVFPDDLICLSSSTLCLPVLLSCLPNLQILDSPSLGRSLRKIGTDQAKTSVELWKPEHRMTSHRTGWKGEKTSLLWLQEKPYSPLEKKSDGERLTANTPTSSPPRIFGVARRILLFHSTASCLQLLPGLSGRAAGTVVLLLPPAVWAVSHHRWVDIHGVSLHSPETRWIHRKYWYDLTLFRFLTVNRLSEPYSYQQSQLLPESPNNWSFVELIQWKHSCNVSDLLPVCKTAPSLHRHTATAWGNAMYYFFELNWVCYSQYLWKINPHCINCL